MSTSVIKKDHIFREIAVYEETASTVTANQRYTRTGFSAAYQGYRLIGLMSGGYDNSDVVTYETFYNASENKVYVVVVPFRTVNNVHLYCKLYGLYEKV